MCVWNSLSLGGLPNYNTILSHPKKNSHSQNLVIWKIDFKTEFQITLHFLMYYRNFVKTREAIFLPLEKALCVVPDSLEYIQQTLNVLSLRIPRITQKLFRRYTAKKHNGTGLLESKSERSGCGYLFSSYEFMNIIKHLASISGSEGQLLWSLWRMESWKKPEYPNSIEGLMWKRTLLGNLFTQCGSKLGVLMWPMMPCFTIIVNILVSFKMNML